VDNERGTEPAATRLSLIGLEEEEDERGGIFSKRLARAELDVGELKERLQAFLSAMEQVIGGVSAAVGRYHLESVTLTAEVSAKGTVSLLGTGGEMAGKGGLTFSFKAKSDAPAPAPGAMP
jgi:hypothetical protein